MSEAHEVTLTKSASASPGSKAIISHTELYPMLPRHGAESIKGRASVDAVGRSGEHRNAGTFFLKKFEMPGRTVEQAREAALEELRKYNMLKDAGIPVPATCRYMEDPVLGPCLAITDLTAGGKNDIWSLNTGMDMKENQRIMDRMNLQEQDFVRLESEIKQISEKLGASEKNTLAVSMTGFSVVGNAQDGLHIVVSDFGDGTSEAGDPGGAKVVTEFMAQGFMQLLRQGYDDARANKRT